MAKKKQTRKAAAAPVLEDEGQTKRALMAPISNDVWQAFADFREARRDARTFPWTVRDCMDIAIREYLEKYDV